MTLQLVSPTPAFFDDLRGLRLLVTSYSLERHKIIHQATWGTIKPARFSKVVWYKPQVKRLLQLGISLVLLSVYARYYPKKRQRAPSFFPVRQIKARRWNQLYSGSRLINQSSSASITSTPLAAAWLHGEFNPPLVHHRGKSRPRMAVRVQGTFRGIGISW